MKDGTHFFETSENIGRVLITPEGINALLKDPKVMDKYINFDENRDYFGGLTQFYIANVVKKYVEFMMAQGEEYDEEALNRLKQVEQVLPEYCKRPIKFKQYDNISRKELYDITMNMLGSASEVDTFLGCQQKRELYHGVSTEVLSKYITLDLYKYMKRIFLSDTINHYMIFIASKETLLYPNAYRLDPDRKMNPELENTIFQAVEKKENLIEYAHDLYDELNKIGKYDCNFFALGQDLKNPKVKEILSKGFEELTKDNAKLVCKQCAEAYAYLIDKIGFEAYIYVDDFHWQVVAFKGTTFLNANPVNILESDYDLSSLNDLTRSKLGVDSVGFTTWSFEEGEEAIDKVRNILDLKYSEDRFEQTAGAQDEVKNLISLISDKRNLSEKIMGIGNNENPLNTALKKIGLISVLLQDSKLDTMEESQYAYELLMNFFPFEQQKQIAWTNAFYQGITTDNCCRIPIISLRLEGEMADRLEEKYLYFIIEPQSHAIQPITRDELKRRVASGQYVQGFGENLKQKSVPGIPEITDPDWVVRNRAEYRLANKKDMKLDKTAERIGE